MSAINVVTTGALIAFAGSEAHPSKGGLNAPWKAARVRRHGAYPRTSPRTSKRRLDRARSTRKSCESKQSKSSRTQAMLQSFAIPAVDFQACWCRAIRCTQCVRLPIVHALGPAACSAPRNTKNLMSFAASCARSCPTIDRSYRSTTCRSLSLNHHMPNRSIERTPELVSVSLTL